LTNRIGLLRKVPTLRRRANKKKIKPLLNLAGHPKKAWLSMDVKVHSPFKSYYEGEAFSVSGENETGEFDILPTHHNFITLLSPCELIIRSPKGDQKIQISGGIMHVKADKVVVFLDV